MEYGEIKEKLVEKYQNNSSFEFARDIPYFLRFMKKYLESEEEIKEEIKEVKAVYQVIAKDSGYSFWLSLWNSKVNYGFDLIPNHTVTLIMPEKVLGDVIYRRKSALTAYMEGSINIEGNLKEAAFFRKLLLYARKELFEIETITV